MELSKQVVSLELAKKLKELGAKQESLYYWREDILRDGGSRSGDFVLDDSYMKPYRLMDSELARMEQYIKDGILIPAYTVAELGEMLIKLPTRNKKGLIQEIKIENSMCTDKDCECGGVKNFCISLVNPSETESKKLVHVEIDYPKETYIPTEANNRAKMLIYLLENKLIEL